MPHILRDVTGRIVAVLDRATAGPSEEVAADHPDLLDFLGIAAVPQEAAPARPGFADLDFVRVLDDLILTLLARKVIAPHDLPREACRKLAEREALRHRIGAERPFLSEDAALIP